MNATMNATKKVKTTKLKWTDRKIFLTPSDIESKGSQVFNVPNNEEGRAFRKQVSKYLNRSHYRLCNRGRGTRPSKRYHVSLPLALSGWIAVYLHDSPAIEKIKQGEISLEIKELKEKLYQSKLANKELKEKLYQSKLANSELVKLTNKLSTTAAIKKPSQFVQAVQKDRKERGSNTVAAITSDPPLQAIKFKSGQTVVIRIDVE